MVDRGIRGQGLKNEKNVKVEVIMREEKLSDIVEEISRTLFANFAIVLYVTDVGVVRPENFKNYFSDHFLIHSSKFVIDSTSS